jgi:uncharacterized membrane protein
MSKAAIGLLAGILLALIILWFGWPGFLLALVLGLVGLAVGAQLDGSVDLADLFRGRRG